MTRRGFFGLVFRVTTMLVVAGWFAPSRTSAAEAADRVGKDVRAAYGVSGGLAVFVGGGDAGDLLDLGSGDGWLVQVLEQTPEAVAELRQRALARGVYGRVSVDRWVNAPGLPYADGLVNLIVIGKGRSVPREELMRVLAPGGVACVPDGDATRTITKPRPESIDAWSHTLHDASNNAVADDTVVGPPQRVQWLAGPRNARHHESFGTVTVAVSSGGRLFSIIDEAPSASILLSPSWNLVARDAFSGVLLWKRAIPTWHSHLHPFRQGPPQIGRRLVATPDRVYVTLGLPAPLTALDARTGRTLTTYEGTKDTEEILYDEGMLVVVVGDPSHGLSARTKDQPAKAILAIDAESAKVLWKREGIRPLPNSLTVGGGRVFYAVGDALVALDAEGGAELWRTPREFAENRANWSSPTVVAHDGVVLCADRVTGKPTNLDERRDKTISGWLAKGGYPGDLVAYDAATGQELWRCLCAEAFHAPIDVFVIDGVVWYGESRARQGPDFTMGRDLRTGEIVRRIRPDKAFDSTMPHHRCYRNRATTEYIVAGRTGVEFIDLSAGKGLRHHWTRGTCQFGTVPCNGLLYVPPHACACYIEAKLTGFYAFAPQAVVLDPPPAEARLERGGADLPDTGGASIAADDWPTYRHDAARTGCTASKAPSKPQVLWRADVGGELTAPVVCGDLAIVASTDTHSVHAIDLACGRQRWRFTAGGRIDSPPSIARGLVVFGSADGWVYCLRVADGKRVWRFRAAPEARRIVVYDQIESTWPVHGSVLIDEGAVTFAAGRSSYIDGGMVLYRLDLETGKLLARRRLYSRDPETGEQPGEPIMFEMAGALPDVLSTVGDRVFMRRLAFDAETLESVKSGPHLYSPAGFLNGDYWHRTYWIYGDHFYSGYIGWFFAGHENAAGRLLCVDDEMIYGYAYKPRYYRGSREREYHLFAVPRAKLPDPGPPDYRRANREYPHRGGGKFKIDFAWKQEVPVFARAMVLADKTLFLAGPPDRAQRSIEVYRGSRGAILLAASAEDGASLGEYKLDALPVYDGLIAARGRLLLSLKDGTLLCLGDAAAGAKPLPEWSGGIGPIRGEAKEPGLVGHWTFDAGQGAMAKDHSGLGNDAEMNGRWVRGEKGACVETRGAAGAVTILDSPLIRFGDESFSMSLWVNLEGYDCRLFGKEAYPRSWWVINVLQNGLGELVLGTGKSNNMRPKWSTPIPKGTWTHLAFVVDRDKGEVRCYLNGRREGAAKIPAKLGDLSVKGQDLTIPSSHKPFVGRVDEVRLYRRALSDDEVNRIYEERQPG